MYNYLYKYLILYYANMNINYEILYFYVQILSSTGDRIREILWVIVYSQYFPVQTGNLLMFLLYYNYNL